MAAVNPVCEKLKEVSIGLIDPVGTERLVSGKTFIHIRYTEGKYKDDSDTTIVEHHSKSLQAGGENIKLHIWDVGGTTTLYNMSFSNIKDRNVVLLCYPVDKPFYKSDCIKLIKDLRAIHKERPIIFVGTKHDLIKNFYCYEEEVIKFIKEYKLDGYFQCSAKTGVGVETVFSEATRIGMNYNDKQLKPKQETTFLTAAFTSVKNIFSSGSSSHSSQQHQLGEQGSSSNSPIFYYSKMASSQALIFSSSLSSSSPLAEQALFLKLVAEGEQGRAEMLLKKKPDLASVPSDVIDLSGRSFKSIPGFQYAIWALDWHMWTMIRKYLPDEAAREQIEKMENGSWIQQHRASASWQNLVDALKVCANFYKNRQWAEGDNVWNNEVNNAQRLLPVHVVNEYCREDRLLDFTTGHLPHHASLINF